jgi:hypothetical protein
MGASRCRYTWVVREQTRNIIRAMLHGMTGAGLFRRLDYPGAPTHLVDPRPIEEILASGVLGRELTQLLKGHEGREYRER